MSPELDTNLCKKYPEIFSDRNSDMSKTAMCWGFECGDGWYPLIDTLCASLIGRVRYLRSLTDSEYVKSFSTEKMESFNRDLAEAESSIPVAVQVKEKFGGLRFYVDSANDEQYAIIGFAESMSYRICEECGTMHDTKLYNLGWMRTLCPTHADEYYGKDVMEEYRKRNDKQK
jgi:hypothetical protein